MMNLSIGQLDLASPRNEGPGPGQKTTFKDPTTHPITHLYFPLGGSGIPYAVPGWHEDSECSQIAFRQVLYMSVQLSADYVTVVFRVV